MTEVKQQFIDSFFDYVIQDKSLKNDRDLGDKLGVSASVISALRHGRLKFGPTYLIRAHKAFGYGIQYMEDFVEGK